MLTYHAPKSTKNQSRSPGDGGGHELAVAGVPVLPPPADSPGPPATASDPSEDETDDEERSADEDEEIHTWQDKTALAPAPEPGFLPGEAGQDVAPPIVPHYYRYHLLCPVYHVPL